MIIHDCIQNSPEWDQMRAGIPTASAFSRIITTKGEFSDSMKDYAIILAAEAYTNAPVEEWRGNRDSERGHRLEPDARKEYNFNRSETVAKIGFVTNDSQTYGCSPDGLVGDDGMTEFKCLLEKAHVKAIMHYNETGKAYMTYHQQIQGQMMVCERDWCDLFFFHPTLPCFMVRQHADPEFQSNLLFALDEVSRLRDEALKALRSI